MPDVQGGCGIKFERGWLGGSWTQRWYLVPLRYTIHTSGHARCALVVEQSQKESNFFIAKTVGLVIIDHTCGLHIGITNGTPYELKSALFEVLAHGI